MVLGQWECYLERYHLRLWLAEQWSPRGRSEEHTSELQSRFDLVCRLLLEKKKKNRHRSTNDRDDQDAVTAMRTRSRGYLTERTSSAQRDLPAGPLSTRCYRKVRQLLH